jgi:hypothetical protein
MSNNLPKTPIGLLREYLDAWALREHLTDEDIANEIVAFHDAAQWQLRSKVYFDESADNTRRRATNRARIFRWLNDSEKDTNLLSVNFLPFVLGAMPTDLRIGFLNDYMRALGLCVAGIDDAQDGEFGINDLAAVMKEDSEAHQACAQVIAVPSLAALRSAEKEIDEAIETKRRAGRLIRAMIRAKSSTGAAINKFLGRVAP